MKGNSAFYESQRLVDEKSNKEAERILRENANARNYYNRVLNQWFNDPLKTGK